MVLINQQKKLFFELFSPNTPFVAYLYMSILTLQSRLLTYLFIKVKM